MMIAALFESANLIQMKTLIKIPEFPGVIFIL